MDVDRCYKRKLHFVCNETFKKRTTNHILDLRRLKRFATVIKTRGGYYRVTVCIEADYFEIMNNAKYFKARE